MISKKDLLCRIDILEKKLNDIEVENFKRDFPNGKLATTEINRLWSLHGFYRIGDYAKTYSYIKNNKIETINLFIITQDNSAHKICIFQKDCAVYFKVYSKELRYYILDKYDKTINEIPSILIGGNVSWTELESIR